MKYHNKGKICAEGKRNIKNMYLYLVKHTTSKKKKRKQYIHLVKCEEVLTTNTLLGIISDAFL